MAHQLFIVCARKVGPKLTPDSIGSKHKLDFNPSKISNGQAFYLTCHVLLSFWCKCMQAEEVIDKVVKEAISKPWLPLPLGLKPPSTESVLTELSKQGISSIPPRTQGMHFRWLGTCTLSWISHSHSMFFGNANHMDAIFSARSWQPTKMRIGKQWTNLIFYYLPQQEMLRWCFFFVEMWLIVCVHTWQNMFNDGPSTFFLGNGTWGNDGPPSVGLLSWAY